MLVIDATPAKPNYKKIFSLVSLGLALSILIIPTLIALATQPAPTGSYLSPLPQNQLTQDQPQPQTDTPELLILTAQAYLEKAISLSQQLPQTEKVRSQIVALLNQSLERANQAVVATPTSPEAYLVRARVLSSSTTIRQDAILLAQKDLEIAQKLANGQTVNLPTNVNLIELLPTEQAGLNQDLIVAAPEEADASSASAASTSNVGKFNAAFPANQTELTLKNSALTTSSYVYLIPSGSLTLFIQSKSDGQITVATTQPPAQPTDFEYWIINP